LARAARRDQSSARKLWFEGLYGSLNPSAFAAMVRAMPDAAFWGVAKTHTQREVWASERLTERGFEIFLPRVASGRVIQPLFRSYLFVRIVEGHWVMIERTMGVLCLIRFGESPAKVPEVEVEALMDRVGPSGVLVLPPAPTPRRRVFRKGDKVRVIAGGMILAAIHTGMTLKQRELVLISVLGATREVAVSRHLIAVQ
jgi:transcriptional antiterminator RfaH